MFSSPEDVEVFVHQKWRDAASMRGVPADEEDNSDVLQLTEWTDVQFKVLTFPDDGFQSTDISICSLSENFSARPSS